MIKAFVLTAAVSAVVSLAQAQTPGAASAPPAAAPKATVSAAKKQLVQRLLKIEQAGVDSMARSIVLQPAMQLSQQAKAALQQVPVERREAVAKDLDADVRKFIDEATPIVRDRANRLAPSTLGTLFEERFSEDELRQLVSVLESPVYRKFQDLAPELQRALGDKLMPEVRDDLSAKVRALQQSMVKHLTPPAAASAPKTGTPGAKN